MVKFCRNCGSELAKADDKTCGNCGTNAVKGTTFCRYCGHPTRVEDSTCNHCGASIKPLPSSARSLFEYPRLSARMGKIINLSLVIVGVTLYVVFTLPKSVTKPIAHAASDTVMAATGYSAVPLNSIEATPPIIPELVTYGMTYVPPGITVNTVRQITVYAVYKNTNSTNGTRAIRLEDITTNVTYISENQTVVTVNQSGGIKATSPGTTNITISYTAAPGSANISSASAGKELVTFVTKVQVIVK